MRLAAAFVVLMATGATALADSEPVIVIPSRPGVPIIINGQDVSYAVLEGDWGLASRIHIQPTVYPGQWQGIYKPPVGHYYPHSGRMPGVGRLEIDAPPRLLPQAESYYRSWGIESQPTPAQTEPPVAPPAVIYAPDGRRPGRHGPHSELQQAPDRR